MDNYTEQVPTMTSLVDYIVSGFVFEYIADVLQISAVKVLQAVHLLRKGGSVFLIHILSRVYINRPLGTTSSVLTLSFLHEGICACQLPDGVALLQILGIVRQHHRSSVMVFPVADR